MCRVPLLPGFLLIRLQPSLDYLGHRVHHRTCRILFPPVLRRQTLQGFADCLACVTRLPCNLTNALLVYPLRRPNVFVLVHLYQLLFLPASCPRKQRLTGRVPFARSNPALVGSFYSSEIKSASGKLEFCSVDVKPRCRRSAFRRPNLARTELISQN